MWKLICERNMTKDLYIKKSLTLWTKYFESKKHVCSILSLVTSFLLTLRFTKPRSFLMDTAAWYTAVGPMLFTPNFSTKRVSSAWRGSKWGSFQPGTNESLRRRGFQNASIVNTVAPSRLAKALISWMMQEFLILQNPVPHFTRPFPFGCQAITLH